MQENPADQPVADTQSLTLTDLTQALQLIQVVAQRGAIRADEMASVGLLHDRLFAFLVNQGAITPASAPTN